MALNEFARALADRSTPDSLRIIRGRAARLARDAEAQPGYTDEAGPDGQSLGDWLRPLRDARPPAAEPADRSSSPSMLAGMMERGTVVYAQTSGGAAPVVSLESPGRAEPAKFVLSAVLAIVLLGGLAWSARERRLVRAEK